MLQLREGGAARRQGLKGEEKGKDNVLVGTVVKTGAIPTSALSLQRKAKAKERPIARMAMASRPSVALGEFHI